MLRGTLVTLSYTMLVGTSCSLCHPNTFKVVRLIACGDGFDLVMQTIFGLNSEVACQPNFQHCLLHHTLSFLWCFLGPGFPNCGDCSQTVICHVACDMCLDNGKYGGEAVGTAIAAIANAIGAFWFILS
jgi:hypothetical protein